MCKFYQINEIKCLVTNCGAGHKANCVYWGNKGSLTMLTGTYVLDIIKSLKHYCPPITKVFPLLFYLHLFSKIYFLSFSLWSLSSFTFINTNLIRYLKLNLIKLRVSLVLVNDCNNVNCWQWIVKQASSDLHLYQQT